MWGDWAESWVSPDVEHHSFSDTFSQSRTDGTPLTVSIVSTPNHWNAASASLGAFTLQLNANSAPSNLGGIWGASQSSIHINGTATTLFRVNASSYALSLKTTSFFNYFEFEQDLGARLTDVTTSVILLDAAHLDFWGGDISYNYLFDTNPSDLYELMLSGNIDAHDAKFAHLSITTAPDSGATAVLLALGLTCLALFRGRRSGI